MIKIVRWLIILICISNVLALSEEAELIENQLNEASKDMLKMQSEGFNVVRYNDSLLLAQQFYNTQLAIEENNETSTYIVVEEKLNEIENLKEKAYTAFDELNALTVSVETTTASNKDPIYELYEKANQAFKAERYEEVLIYTEETYDMISEMESVDTKLRAWSSATSRSFSNTLKENWKAIFISIIVIILLFIVLYDPIMKLIITKKLQMLDMRDKSIKELTAKTQKEFFEDQTLNEGTYHARLKKYGELLRDIHRQIPLLKERLVKHQSRFKRKR